MSLAAYAIRTTLWRALYDHTSAGKMVFDSSINPLEELLQGTPQPVIVISTEDEEVTEMAGFELLGATRELTLIIEVAIGTAMKDRAGYVIEQTDDGLEQSLNYIVHQIFRIMSVDSGDDWGDLFRSFAYSITGWRSRRGASGEQGIKFAARQLQFTCEPIAEPDFGVPPYEEWERLITAMAADTEMFADEAPGLQAEIIGDVIPAWAQLQARTGLRRGAMEGVGVGPLTLLYPDKVTVTMETAGDHLNSVNTSEEDA